MSDKNYKGLIYKKYDRTDKGGADIAEYHNNLNDDTCLEKCNLNSNCAGIALSTPNKKDCWLKDNRMIDKKRAVNNNRIIYEKNKENIDNDGFKYEKNYYIDIPGYDIQYIRQNLSDDFCLKKCNDDNNCGGIAINTNRKECWLKDNRMKTGKSNINSNRITYKKISGQKNNNNSNTTSVNRNGVNYKLTKNIDANGDDLTGLGGSREDCLDKCNDLEECRGFAYDKPGGVCYIKNSAIYNSRKGPNTNQDVYLKDPNYHSENTTTINRNGVNYTVKKNTDSGGDDLTGLGGSQEDCLDKCNNLEECRGFAYDKLGNVCYIKNSGIYNSRKGNDRNQDVYLKDPNYHSKNTETINRNGVDYTFMKNTDSGGDDLTGLGGSREDCLDKCNKLEDCRGFAYDKLGNVCYIKNSGIYKSRKGDDGNQDVYLKDPNSHIKIILPTSCEYTLTDDEAQCYLNRYPDLNKAFGSYSNKLDLAKDHWKSTGCKESRNNQCPFDYKIGDYVYKGCYQDNQNDRILTKKVNNVSDIAECHKQAKDPSNLDLYFGVENNNECWLGMNIGNQDKLDNKYIVDKNKCENNNNSNSIKLYEKENGPYDENLYKRPSLNKDKNFNEKFNNTNIENFDDKSKIINDGYNELYNEIFCNLFQTNQGFTTCENCDLSFNNKEIWKRYELNSDNDCLEKCAQDKMCTSYTFDKKLSTNNCMLYSTFPNEIKKNVDNINSGYSMRFQFDYNTLSDLQKKNIQKKCLNQYINNTYTKNKKINLESCIKVNEKNKNKENLSDIIKAQIPQNFHPFVDPQINSLPEENRKLKSTRINLDPECVWNIYNKEGVSSNIRNMSTYNNGSNYPNVQSDPIIDKYQTNYNINNGLQNQFIKINNNSKKNDNSNSDNDLVIKEQNKILEQDFIDSIKNKEKNIRNPSLIENYSNQVNYLFNYKIIGIIIIIVILILSIIFFLK
jgi:hypothetical protein